MSTPASIRFKAFLVVALCCASLWTSDSTAEVGVGGEAHFGVAFEISLIVDDPDPFGSAWGRYVLDSPGRVVLNEDGNANGDGRPSFLIDPFSDLPIVAWSRNSAQGYDVVVSHFADGEWSEPLSLASSPADELDPFLLLDPADGTVHVFYWIHDASPRVMHRQAPADLSSWSLPEQVSQPGEIASRPAAVFHAGALTVVYEVHELGYQSTPRRIVIATHDGLSFVASTIAFTTYPGPNRPQVHSRRNKLWVEWIDSDGSMSWTRRTASGDWDPVQVEGFSGAEDRDYHVRGRVKALALE